MPGMVTLKLTWEYKDVHGGQIKTFEPPAEIRQVWWMKSFEKGEPYPRGVELKDGIVFLKPGEEALVELVFENPAGEPQSFWAVPHVITPSELMPQTILRCLCSGEEYKVPAEGTWVRVIGLKADRTPRAGGRARVTLNIKEGFS